MQIENPAKNQVIRFATSLIHNTEYQPDITEQFLQLLIKTSLAAPFYARHGDELPAKYNDRFKTIHKGVTQLNEKHEQTLDTLDAAPVPYYLCKEWVAPWPHRYSCDVDILIHPDDLPELHDYLHDNGYLVDGAEIQLPEQLRDTLFELNTDQTQLNECIHELQETYEAIQSDREHRRNEAQKHLETLQQAEQDYLAHTDMQEQYQQLTEDRTVTDERAMVQINAEIHKRFESHVKEHPDTRPQYTQYDTTYHEIQEKLTTYASTFGGTHAAAERAENKPDEMLYQRGAEFLEVKTYDRHLDTTTAQLQIQENTVHPVDNLIINAAHFTDLLGKRVSTHEYHGFLKYLLDGAFLLKRHEPRPETIRHRAVQLGRSTAVKYYLYLLRNTGLADLDADIPPTQWFNALTAIPEEHLLFNEKNPLLHVLYVAKHVGISTLFDTA